MRNEFQDEANYELNRSDKAKLNLPNTVKCRHSPSADLNLRASGSLRKSNTARNLNSQKIYHCRKYRLGHFAILHRFYVTMEEGKRKNGSDISHGSRSSLPPSLRDAGNAMRINLGVTSVASVAVRMNIALCLLHASY